MEQYIPLLGFLILAIVFAVGSFVTSSFIAPKRASAAKRAPYESGIVPKYEPASRFSVRFYLVAMIFVIFDIEIIFLYPWAVRFTELGLFGLVEMSVFTVAVVISLAYLISNGALDWGPVVKKPKSDEASPMSSIKLIHKPAVDNSISSHIYEDKSK